MRGHNQTVLEDLNNCDLCCLVQTIQGSSRNWIAIWQNFLDCPFDDSFGKNHFRRLFPKSLPHLCPASLLGHALWILWHLWLSNLLFHPGNFVCHLLWTTVVVQQAIELVWRSDRMTVWDLNFHIFQRCAAGASDVSDWPLNSPYPTLDGERRPPRVLRFGVTKP